MSCRATFYRAGAGGPTRFRDGAAYYWPSAKKKGSGARPPLRLRLLRVRAPKRGSDVWLATSVLDRRRLSVAQAARFYPWRGGPPGLSPPPTPPLAQAQSPTP